MNLETHLPLLSPLFLRSLKFHPGRSVLKEGTMDFPNARAVCMCACLSVYIYRKKGPWTSQTRALCVHVCVLFVCV